MTRSRPPLAALLLAVPLALPAPAGAAVPHTVEPGETLWTIAAASNLTTRTLAAYNGLPEDGHVILGSTIQIPSEAEGAAALANAGLASTGTPAATQTAAGAAPVADAAAPAPMGSYTVRPGDTLSKLAAVAGVSVDAIAGMNGLDPAGFLLSGTVIKLPTGSPTPPAAEEPAPTATVVPEAAPNPTPGRVTANDIAQVASAHGVPGSLASAIAWQESGFNNSMVSSANARGVMQVMPGTWSWVQDNLTDRPLNPDSPTDNVHAGVLYLRQLLDETGGDEDTAIAGYYQGLGSVRERGLYDDTKRYVENVQALRGRFGG
ncbi:MAG: GH23 / CBM50 [uncultured Solirubrobacteraceae bacterium]|uniref:GH23 / CBM50 n=1 Tax=uncultured Solirubrobacteraceae bacterium TaxID=1162706 RepID=A0A6J4SER0_9ACTN|nr:MAG: GH23 / CBM50 [uncultured Solirubrobacteraceae bacterium]